MVKTRHIEASEALRLEAVSLWKHHPQWSFQTIANKIGCSYVFVSKWVKRHQQFGQVRDKPRSGRPHKADAAAVQHVVEASQHPECFSAADIASKVQQDFQLEISISSVKRLLRRKGYQHLSPKVVCLLTAKQKLARVRFAKAAAEGDLGHGKELLSRTASTFGCMPRANLLADGVHQPPGALLGSPSTALQLMYTWA